MGNEIIEQWSYSEFVTESIDRKRHINCGYESSKSGSFDFTATKNIQESIDYARNGWDLGLEQYKIEDGTLENGSTIMSPSLAGCLPHVQNFIMGFPEQMYNLYDEREYDLPKLDIVIHLAYSANEESDDALTYGKSIVSYINAMASNYNIRLTGVIGQGLRNSKKMYHLINLKDFDSALVINNVAFAFHPSFFRRLWFSIFEGKEYWQGGYGTPIHDCNKPVTNHLNKLGTVADKTVVFKSLGAISSYKFDADNIDYFTY